MENENYHKALCKKIGLEDKDLKLWKECINRDSMDVIQPDMSITEKSIPEIKWDESDCVIQYELELKEADKIYQKELDQFN